MFWFGNKEKESNVDIINMKATGYETAGDAAEFVGSKLIKVGSFIKETGASWKQEASYLRAAYDEAKAKEAERAKEELEKMGITDVDKAVENYVKLAYMKA